ncbi:MAG TPA: SRPBCC family protein [Capillimicrobium sp.]|jgi:hypothetical protein
MRRFEQLSAAPGRDAWALYADPDRWPDWAPHLRGAWGLGHGEVREGARGAVRLLGVVPVPATILTVTSAPPDRVWTWRVGPVTMAHRVEERPGVDGCTVALELTAPGPLEGLVAATYGPVVDVLLRSLSRRAAAA